MKKILHHLRRQPEEVRRHVLHLIILIVALVMLGLWILSLGSNLSNTDTQEKMKKDLAPFSQLKDNVLNTNK